MKTWLKGGLWGVGISIVLSLFSFLGDFFYMLPFFNMFLGLPLSYIQSSLFGVYIGDPSSASITSSIMVFYINPLITAFIIGSIIGLIIQKVKSRRNK